MPGTYPSRCPLLLSPQILFLSNTYFINYSVHNLVPPHSNRMAAYCKCHLKIERYYPTVIPSSSPSQTSPKSQQNGNSLPPLQEDTHCLFPPHCPWGILIAWCQPLGTAGQRKVIFQALIVKALHLKALKALLDLYFITMNLLVSIFICQTFKTHSL